MTLCTAETGEPVACFGGIPYAAHYRGRPVRILHAVDNMSHPRYRGVLTGRKGLFVQLVEHFLTEVVPAFHIAFVYGYPGERHYRLGHLLLGYEPLPRSLVAMDRCCTPIQPKSSVCWRVAEEIPTEAHLSALWESSTTFFPFTVRRDARFFTWRFLKHPFSTYRFWTCRRRFGRALCGYVVWKCTDGQAILVDLFWNGSEAAMAALVRHSVAQLLKDGLADVQAWVPQHGRLPQLFQALRFAFSPKALNIVPAYVHRPLSPLLAPDEAAPLFYGTMADADLF